MTACDLICEAEDLERAALELWTSALQVLGCLDPFAVARVKAGSESPGDLVAYGVSHRLCDDLWRQAGTILDRCRRLLDWSDVSAEHAIADDRATDIERATGLYVRVTRAVCIAFNVQQITLNCMNLDGARERR